MVSIELARKWILAYDPLHREIEVVVMILDGPISCLSLNESCVNYTHEVSLSLPARPSGFYHHRKLLSRSAVSLMFKLLDANYPQRYVPILVDLFQSSVEYAGMFTHVIYTNIDIGVMPNFYKTVLDLIVKGKYNGAFFINR